MKEGHINNLYNTTFWTLIQKGGFDAKSAEKELAVSLQISKKSTFDNYSHVISGVISRRQE